MTDYTFHTILISFVIVLIAITAVSVAFAAFYRRKYLMVIKDNETKVETNIRNTQAKNNSEEISLFISERDKFLVVLHQKAKEGVQITNDEILLIENWAKAFRNDNMENAINMHKRTSRISIMQTYLHIWGLADHEIAVLFNTTRQSVHNNWNRLLNNIEQQ